MKRYAIGFITGVLMMLSTTAFAAIGDSVTAVFSQFTFVVNGETKTLDADPLVYQGSSYLPVRTVANLLGYDVVWKADGRTIEFSGGPKQVAAIEPSEETAPLPQEPGDSPPATDSATTVEPPISTEPSTSEAPTAPTQEPTAEPAPTPNNTAACQAIRDDYAGKIAMVQYGPGSLGKHKQQVLLLEYERDRKLSDTGC